MIDTRFMDELSQKISAALPSGIKMMQDDLEKNIKAILQSSFEKMNLVSREEFDIQAALLERTRQKLDALEQQLAELENKI